MIIVDTINVVAHGQDGLMTAAESGLVTIHTRTGATAVLDLANDTHRGWASIVEELQSIGAPAYLKVAPSTGRVEQLLIPEVFTVVGVSPVPAADQHEVELFISHARHHVRVSSPDYSRLLNALLSAFNSGEEVLVTETLSGNEIIDVRSVANLPRQQLLLNDHLGTGVSISRAQEFFRLTSGTACPAQPSSAILPPCIPFLYPEDGCWARAHSMLRILTKAMTPAEKALLRKVWIYGRLSVHTNHTPACHVSWGWHVAPAIPVDVGSPAAETYMIDPSLFEDIVTLERWRGVQSDPTAIVVDTDPSVYQRQRNGQVLYDPDYSKTDSVLTKYRLKLKNRVISSGSPPYQC